MPRLARGSPVGDEDTQTTKGSEASPQPAPQNDAAEATRAASARVLLSLPFADKEDFELAHRGLMARPKSLIIKDVPGNVAWDMEACASDR